MLHLACVTAILTLHQDLTRVESGHETMFNEPFDLPTVIMEATNLYKNEAQRKSLDFEVDLARDLRMVVGDSSKVRTVVANLTANARKELSFLIFYHAWTASPSVKYTQRGTITVSCHAFNEPEGLRNSKQIAVEIIVGDTGCGIPASKLENIFREFEQVESAQPKTSTGPGLGLGLAVVARSVEQLGGQLRVDSKVDQGSRFSFLISFTVWDGCGRHLAGQGGYRQTGAPVSHPSLPSSLGADMSVEHDLEVPDDLSVSPQALPGQDDIDNVTVTADSRMVVPPESVAVEVKAVDITLRPRPPLRRGTVHPEDRPQGQGGETKLRILSVEVRYTVNI